VCVWGGTSVTNETTKLKQKTQMQQGEQKAKCYASAGRQ